MTDSTSAVSYPRSRIGTTYADEHDNDPGAILTPQGLGDGRPDRDDTAPSTFDKLLSLPDDLLSFGEYLRDIRNVVTEFGARTLWVSSAVANVQGATATIDTIQYAFITGFQAQLGFAVQLRHIQVGSDTAGLILLFATRGVSPDSRAGGVRSLGAIRVTATNPTGYSNLEPILDDGENLIVALQAASGKLDFACEYRALRSGN